jgi:rubrerythrin
MSFAFNADDVFEMAEQIERNGAKFYRSAAETIQDAETREKLLGLAVMEDGREKVFAAMRKELTIEEMTPTAFDPDGELALYLRALADVHVFDTKTGLSSRLDDRESAQDILMTAIGLEKDSIVFYLGIREMVPEQMGRKKVDGIIKEEMSHITLLNGQIRALK